MNWVTQRANYPALRHRRKRQTSWTRELVSENHLLPQDLILPVFVHEHAHSVEIPTMPGVQRLSIPDLVEVARNARALGIPALALFPVVDTALKTDKAEESYNPDNLVCRAVRAVKESGVDIGLVCDVALDPYTSHGQDGLVENNVVVNDATVDVLCQQAIAQARAGCDIIAPSDMMDGRIGAIRGALDEEGFSNVLIMSYAAKYASAFYGPFRDAVGSATNLGTGDKRTYQMDPANTDEALREVATDLDEGADIVMVKPGLPYLDVIRRIKDTFAVPTAAYHVSGEYAMIKVAAAQGCFDERACMLESLLGFKRAGADMVLTYAALDAARWLSE
ncbi:MAG: porphobilinogen synthase [Myxococcota bacterium]|nr:porphobilinogen synthase [Myxococcota bacterium]